MTRRHRWALVPLFLAVLLAACSKGPAEEEEGEFANEPLTVTPVKGTDLSTIKITAEAAKRLGLTTQFVVAIGRDKVIGAGTVLFDPEGKQWVFTNPQPFTYVRQEVQVDHFSGDIAVLAEGPPAGTKVVTLGAAEMYGAETGLEED